MNNTENKPDPRMVRFRDIGVNKLFRSYYWDYAPGDNIYQKTSDASMIDTVDKFKRNYPMLPTDWVYPCDEQGNITGDSKP